mgnify:FL=1
MTHTLSMSPSYLAVSSDGGQEEVIEMPASTVCGYLMMQHPMMMSVKTAKITVTPQRVIHEGIVPIISWTGSLW